MKRDNVRAFNHALTKAESKLIDAMNHDYRDDALIEADLLTVKYYIDNALEALK